MIKIKLLLCLGGMMGCMTAAVTILPDVTPMYAQLLAPRVVFKPDKTVIPATSPMT